MKKFGFTLSELMIALAILGVVAAITLPRLNNSMPNHNKMMMKKAYYTIEEVVSELISDSKLYPEIDSSGNKYVGFDNLENACDEKPEDSTEGNGADFGGQLDSSCQGLYKFPKLFAKKLNVVGDLSDKARNLVLEWNKQNCVQRAGMLHCPNLRMDIRKTLQDNSTVEVGFSTSDGMVWSIEGMKTTPTEVTTAGESGTTHKIVVDVNGAKSPNCYQGSEGGCTASRTKDFDQFVVYITKSGKVVPKSGQPWFEDAISVDSSLNGD